MKPLFFIPLVIFSTSLSAQYYTFDASTDLYENLDKSKSLNDSMTWQNTHYDIPIGFDFSLYDKTIKKIILNGFGWGGSLTSSTKGIYTLLIAYGSDLLDRGYNMISDTITPESKSNISYQLDSINNRKILKIQWENAGFYHELADDSISSDYINLDQGIKKYEPKEALIGDNKEGLKFYKEIIKKFRNNIKLNGYLAFEIGDNQFMQINKLLILNGFILVSKYKLINNQIRCLLAKKVKN